MDLLRRAEHEPHGEERARCTPLLSLRGIVSLLVRYLVLPGLKVAQ
jgi:hypothetical protein